MSHRIVFTRQVVIPSRDNHRGQDPITVTLKWECPVCGHLRGEVFDDYSSDGPYNLACSRWNNPCGHIDYYSQVRDEARTNGLNTALFYFRDQIYSRDSGY